MTDYPIIDFINTLPEQFSNVYHLRRLYSVYSADKHYTPGAQPSPEALIELRGQLISFIFSCTQGEPDAAFVNYILEVWRKNLDRIEYRPETGQIFFEDRSSRLFEIVISDLALFIVEGGLKLLSKISVCEVCKNFYLPTKMPTAKFCSTKCRMANHRKKLKEKKYATA
jgi:hypothetical protein